MNLSAAVMLVNKAVRPLRAEYDPDNYKNNSPYKNFKTIDPTLKKGDLVVVETGTRHGFTIAKVTEIDFAVDFNDPTPWHWAAKFDADTFKAILETDEKIRHKVAKIQENKMRQELMAAHGLGDVDFSDLDLMSVGKPAIEAQVKEAPAADFL